MAYAAANYYALMVQRTGNQDLIIWAQCRYIADVKRPLYTKERLLQDFDFPIAFSNGTRDFFGNAEGPDRVVKNNKYFKTG